MAKNKYNAMGQTVTDNTEKAAGDSGSTSVLFDDAGNDTMGRKVKAF